MILRLAALCESAHQRDDGRLDLNGVFHELSAPGFPAMQEHMTAVFLIEWQAAEAGRQPLRADMIDAHGRKLLTIQGHTDVEQRSSERAPAQTHLIIELEKVVFPAAGLYRFDLSAAGHVVPACSLFVGTAATSG